MDITDEQLRARATARLKTVTDDLAIYDRLIREKAVLESLLEKGSATMADMPLLSFLFVDDGAEAAPEPIKAPRKVPVKQNERGSKAWNEGRAGRDSGEMLVAGNPYKHGTLAFLGWDAGWREHEAEILAADVAAQSAQSPLPRLNEPDTETRVERTKAWMDGRKARDNGPIAQYLFDAGTPHHNEWIGGHFERSAEIAAEEAAKPQPDPVEPPPPVMQFKPRKAKADETEAM